MIPTGKEGGRVAALYIRVSTLDQAREGYSLAAQQAALEAWAAAHGYATQLYADEGISGKDIGHRPAMRQMLADVEAGKIAVVAVWAFVQAHPERGLTCMPHWSCWRPMAWR